jgi:hypothetical protein
MKIQSAYKIALVVFLISAVSYGRSGSQVPKGNDAQGSCGGCSGKSPQTPGSPEAGIP